MNSDEGFGRDDDGGNTAKRCGTNEILRVEGLSVGYADVRVLENLDFAIAEGETVAILGPSGCGKTTLMQTLIGLLPPLAGRICLAGETFGGSHTDENLGRVHRHFGVMFQSDALLGSLSLADNVSLPIEEFTDLPAAIIEEMVRLKLDLVRLGPYARSRPAELSGGMKKRAGLARAMALDPRILFCDEPTAGLDPPTALEVDRLLLNLRKTLGITIVVVSHELSSIENVADRCLMLDKERQGIIAVGHIAALRGSADSRVRDFFRRRLEHRPGEEKGT